jgi:peptide/nickel transport system permease protein
VTRAPTSDSPAAAAWLSGAGLSGAGLSGRLVDPGPWRAIWRRFRRSRGSMVALGVVIAVIALSAAAPLIAPYAPDALLDMVALKSRPPSLTHLFGTDPVSRDVLSRVLFGGRVSLVVAVLAMLTATTVGTCYGAVAGYAGGAVDEVMMRITDACLSIPRVLLLLTVSALWGRLSLAALVLVLGLTGWFGISRLVRAEVMALRTREWALAARSLGASGSRVLLRHLLPNVLSPVIVVTTLGIANVILLEAGLSYLGVGVQPPRASWGNIMQDGADQVRALWWMSVFPGLAIATTVVAINAVGDGLREAADPREPAGGIHG